ncbi:hypothetical protein OSB04_032042 [Centaurea solstitialis]|uniref:Protein ALP1-like n=1 Tax=Centaurea solstitialis TaxID=347529 RepID=A0AA38SA79_9ASTR|nr:hypothetical protein OSB04_032042 [Centaurea solstitialis]
MAHRKVEFKIQTKLNLKTKLPKDKLVVDLKNKRRQLDVDPKNRRRQPDVDLKERCKKSICCQFEVVVDLKNEPIVEFDYKIWRRRGNASWRRKVFRTKSEKRGGVRIFKTKTVGFSFGSVFSVFGSVSVFPAHYRRVLEDGETTSKECLENFCQGIIHLYRRKYLQKPTASDIQAIYAKTRLTRPSVILEAVASHDQWIWHAFFAVPGATNDIIVVNQSPIFNDLFKDKAPDSSFVVNDTHYKHGYYFADGIYPEWATFVKSFKYPTDERQIEFAKRQESAKKDIERTFATLQEKWHVVDRPVQTWTQKKLKEM